MNLQEELQKKYDKTYINKIAEYLLKRIETDNYLLEKMQSTEKNLGGCLAFIKEEAKKQAEDNVAVIADEDVYQWASHYFLEDEIKTVGTIKEEEPKAIKVVDKPKKIKKVKEQIGEQLSLFDL